MGYPDKCGDAGIHGWRKLHSRPPRLHTDKDYAEFLGCFPDTAPHIDYLDWLV